MPAGANQGIPSSGSAGLLPCDAAMFMRSVFSRKLHRGPQIACRPWDARSMQANSVVCALCTCLLPLPQVSSAARHR